MKRLKIVAIWCVAAFAVIAHLQKTSGAQEQSTRLWEIASMEMPFEKRVGVDDGAAFVVHFSGETRGALDTCG